MKRRLFSVALALVFVCSISAFADDGETGNGGRAIDPPPASESSTSIDLLTQFLDIVYPGH